MKCISVPVDIMEHFITLRFFSQIQIKEGTLIDFNCRVSHPWYLNNLRGEQSLNYIYLIDDFKSF